MKKLLVLLTLCILAACQDTTFYPPNYLFIVDVNQETFQVTAEIKDEADYLVCNGTYLTRSDAELPTYIGTMLTSNFPLGETDYQCRAFYGDAYVAATLGLIVVVDCEDPNTLWRPTNIDYSTVCL